MQNYDFFYFAKQPILDANLSTYGYELLFRSSMDTNYAEFGDPEMATISMLTSGFIKSQEGVKQNHRIFINFTENLLLNGAPRALPPAAVVIEVLEDVGWSQTLFNELLKYKQEGYLIAIDDYTGKSLNASYLDIADIIKVDVLGCKDDDIRSIVAPLQGKNMLKLAEKVEDGKAYRNLQNLGFDLFQGYFFSRPENYSGKKLNSMQTSRLRILAALQKSELETEEIVRIIAADPSIAYRLLALLNSAAFGFSMKIESIQHAVVLLGLNRLKYWLHMVILSDLKSQDAEHFPEELFMQALTRGKILEELVVEGYLGTHRPESIFLFGLFSLLDVMLDTPFEDIFTNLPLPSEFKSGYLTPDSELSPYIELLAALEDNDVDRTTGICEDCKIESQALMAASVRAHTWAISIMKEIM